MRAVRGVWVVAVAGAAACAPAPDEGSMFEVTIAGDGYEVLPVARESMAAHGESLLIDLRRDDAVYLIDGRAPVADLVRTPLVCPNGMRTNVADFLIGQAIGWGERGSMIALSVVAPERVEAVVGAVVDWCTVECLLCPDGATLCLQVGECEADVSGLAQTWFTERAPPDEPHGEHGPRTDPPAWNGPPPDPDPTPYSPDEGGDPWSAPGAEGGGGWGAGGGDDGGGDGGGGWSGGGAGGPSDPW